MSEELHDDIRAAMEAAQAKEDEKPAGVEVEDGSDEGADDPDMGGDKDGGEGAATTPDKEGNKDAPASAASDKDGKDSDGGRVHGEGERDKTEGDATSWSPEKAPTSWSPKIREKWGQLPEDVRKEIVRREEASVNGVRKLQEDFQPIKQFAERLSPVMQEARSLGQDPSQYVINLAIAERGLRNEDPNQKFHALLNIADQYGIPLRQYLGGTPQQQQAPTIPPQLQQELEAMRRWRDEQQQTTVQNQIAEFSKDKEFFEDVREQMANLLDSGVAKDLNSAYETACWAHPDVREVMIARQGTDRKKGEQNQRRANAAGASISTGTSPEVDVAVDDGDDSISGLIRKQMVAQTGRV